MPEPTHDDNWYAWKLADMADRRGLPQSSAARKAVKFLAGRQEHGQRLHEVDWLGEALKEADDAMIYPALRLLLSDSIPLQRACLQAMTAAARYERAIVECLRIEAEEREREAPDALPLTSTASYPPPGA